MKNDLLKVRLGEAEKQAFQQAAEIAGVPLSSWVRERLRRAARIELVDADRSVPFLRQYGESRHER